MVRDIRNVLKDNNGTTLFKYFRTKLSRIRIEVFGIFQTVVLKVIHYLNIKEIAATSIPSTPVDGQGGVVYVKASDGKPYYKSYKSNEVSETSLLSGEGRFFHQASMGESTAASTNIYTFDIKGWNSVDTDVVSLASGSIGASSITLAAAHQNSGLYIPYNVNNVTLKGIIPNYTQANNEIAIYLYKGTPSLSSATAITLTLIDTVSVTPDATQQYYSYELGGSGSVTAGQLLFYFLINKGHDGAGNETIYTTFSVYGDLSV